MKKFTLLLIVLTFIASVSLAQEKTEETQPPEGFQPDTRVDNNAYWKRMARLGLAKLNPVVDVPKARYTGSEVRVQGRVSDSPDVAVTSEPSTQSENSIFVNPNDPDNVLNTNNSTPQNGGSVYGADGLFTFDGAITWEGSVQGTGGDNQGDPAAAIGHDGTYYNGFIYNDGQGVAVSDDQGETWSRYVVAPGPSGFSALLDKNHMWIDNAEGPYQGTLYNAWTNFGGSNDEDIEMSISTDKGQTWTQAVNISQAINTSGHHQGVNISTGPNGEAYVVWAIYDNWPQDENSMGFTRSLNGGGSWEPAWRIIDNIHGIRNTETSKNMRVNSFPSMAVDCSEGPYSGHIYVFWANYGVPGVNSGPDIDIYMIKSTDQGDTWSDPLRVNQDPVGLGNEHYLPWAAVDAVTGAVSVVYYDDRNVNPNECEVYVSYSTDGGNTWEDMKVSDVAFTPTPIPGLASGYFGDYLGLHAHGGKVYPVWTDNRTGTAMAYVSPFTLGVPPEPVQSPEPVNNASQVGVFTDLHWEMGDGFEPTSYKVYFGTDNPPTNLINGEEVTEPFYSFSDLLDYTTGYYWRIDAVNDFGETTGETWSFTTNREPDENFESGTFNDYPWQFEGNAEWIIDDQQAFNGTFSSRSGDIGVDEYSSLVLEASVDGLMGFITFHRKTQSVGIFNKLIFLIDGEVMDEWSGNSEWTEESFPVSGGLHTFEWRFVKGEPGDHHAWIDYIYFPPFAPLSANAGADGEVCEGLSYQLNGQEAGATSIEWSTNGDGSFDDNTLLDATYTPGSQDIADGNVVLTLTVSDESGSTADDQMNLAIIANPTAPESLSVDFNDFCSGSIEEIVLSAQGGSGDTLKWYLGECGGEMIAYGTEVIIDAPLETSTYYAMWENTCGMSECQEIMVNVLQLPDQPEQPVGPELVFVNMTPQSEYSVSEVAGAGFYEWELSPGEAGSMVQTNEMVEISWNLEYIGEATLVVSAINDCGEQISEALTITVDNNVGIGEQQAGELTILPNPNTGSFQVQLPFSINENHKLEIINTAGNAIYTMDIEAGSTNIPVQIRDVANGMYYLKVSGNQLSTIKKIIIKK